MVFLDVAVSDVVIEPVTECFSQNQGDDGGKVEEGSCPQREAITARGNRGTD